MIFLIVDGPKIGSNALKNCFGCKSENKGVNK